MSLGGGWGQGAQTSQETGFWSGGQTLAWGGTPHRADQGRRSTLGSTPPPGQNPSQHSWQHPPHLAALSGEPLFLGGGPSQHFFRNFFCRTEALEGRVAALFGKRVSEQSPLAALCGKGGPRPSAPGALSPGLFSRPWAAGRGWVGQGLLEGVLLGMEGAGGGGIGVLWRRGGGATVICKRLRKGSLWVWGGGGGPG